MVKDLTKPLYEFVKSVYSHREDLTIQVVNTQDQLLSGVEITVEKSIGGEDVNVGQGTTGADGTVTFWLNPDFSHTFTLVKTGYTTYVTSFFPTQTGYTITMGGGTTASEDDFTSGIVYTIFPKGELFNDTTYSFEFNVTSVTWDLESFGFNLRLANGSSAGSDSSVVEGSPSIVSYDVNNQSTIYMDYYWIIEGNTTTGNTYWIITNTEYTDWSIKTFFTDLNAYIDDGLFGLDDFGKYLIVFIIIFLSVGVMSYKYGLVSPMAVTTLIFGVVYFFDVVVGLIPEIRGIEHLLTYLAGLILSIVLLREVTR